MYSKINEKVVEKAAELAKGLLEASLDEMDIAYLNSDGNTGLRVSLKFKFSAGKNDTMAIDADINFIESQIKNGMSAYVNPNQEELEFDVTPAKRTTYLWRECMNADPHGQAYITYEETD